MRALKALLLATVFLIADMSALASATPFEEDVIEEETVDRMPFRGDKFSTEDYGWWLSLIHI